VTSPSYDEITSLPISSITQDEYAAAELPSPIELT
jgi:hypothetical protein